MPFGGIETSGRKPSLSVYVQDEELSSDGMHTGRYTLKFDSFTHFRTTMDSPGWFVFTLQVG